MVDDRRISNRNDVVAEMATTEPYKEIIKELEKKKKQTSVKSNSVSSNTRH
jgi:hypothetical protein